jgi:hypothetical protein
MRVAVQDATGTPPLRLQVTLSVVADQAQQQQMARMGKVAVAVVQHLRLLRRASAKMVATVLSS